IFRLGKRLVHREAPRSKPTQSAGRFGRSLEERPPPLGASTDTGLSRATAELPRSSTSRETVVQARGGGGRRRINGRVSRRLRPPGAPRTAQPEPLGFSVALQPSGGNPRHAARCAQCERNLFRRKPGDWGTNDRARPHPAERKIVQVSHALLPAPPRLALLSSAGSSPAGGLRSGDCPRAGRLCRRRSATRRKP